VPSLVYACEGVVYLVWCVLLCCAGARIVGLGADGLMLSSARIVFAVDFGFFALVVLVRLHP
jgi:hypothetical protein